MATRDLFAQVKGILFDLNGVFYVDGVPIEGGAEVISHVHSLGIPCRFTTNTTTRSLGALWKDLKAMGLPVEQEEIFSPTRAAALYLQKLGKPTVHLLVNENTKEDFADFKTSHTNPDVIVLGDIGERWNYTILNQCFEMMMYGAKLVALHRGRYWQKEGKLHMDIGAFVAGLEYVTGKTAEIIGKPSESFFQMSVNDMGVTAQDIAMLGDDIDSDVGGAQNAGLKGVLVKTGKYRPEQVAASRVNPDGVLENIAELQEYL